MSKHKVLSIAMWSIINLLKASILKNHISITIQKLIWMVNQWQSL